MEIGTKVTFGELEIFIGAIIHRSQRFDYGWSLFVVRES